MVGTHVDDLLYGFVEEMTNLMNYILGQIILGKDSIQKFRFCGREFCQNLETFEISVTCEKTTLKMEPIRLAPGRSSVPDDNATKDEISQLRSIVGSESWVVRSCRPDHSYDVSSLQQAMNKATVSDLLDANHVMKELQATSTRGLTFKPGLDWYKSITCAIGDSSSDNETKWIN